MKIRIIVFVRQKLCAEDGVILLQITRAITCLVGYFNISVTLPMVLLYKQTSYWNHDIAYRNYKKLAGWEVLNAAKLGRVYLNL
jgi:hypothetical protein